MRYKLQVADRETGNESEMLLDAASDQEARERASKAGYLVGRIEAIQEPPPTIAKAGPSAVELNKPIAPVPNSEEALVGLILGIVGAILGLIVGYELGGFFGIFIGGLSGIIGGLGIGLAIAPPPEMKLTNGGARVAFGGFAVGMALLVFYGSCIMPLNWWNGFGFGSSSSSRTYTPTYTAPAASSNRELERSIENLSNTLERNKQYAPESLNRARDYARSEYERNQRTMSASEAQRLYRRDLANIEQEERDKGIGR